MIKFLFFTILLLVVGCASSNKEQLGNNGAAEKSSTIGVLASAEEATGFNFQAFLKNASSVNQKMRGEFYEEMKKNLSGVTREHYFAKLDGYSSSVPTEFKRDLKKFEEIVVQGHEKTFVVCGFSKDLEFSFCDDSLCGNVENTKHSSVNKINELNEDLPLSRCGKN